MNGKGHKGSGYGLIVLAYYHGICLDEEENHEKVSMDNSTPGRYLNLGTS
jgi:hypothetical protein